MPRVSSAPQAYFVSATRHSSEISRPGETWLSVAVFLSALAFQLPLRTRWLALLDEGYILAIADDINRGQILYRDVTIDAPFPLAFYLLAIWFRLTETSIASSRWLATFFFAGYATALFRVSRAVLPLRWALGFAVLVLCYRVWAFPHWQIYSYSMVAATLAVLAGALALGAERRRSLPGLFATGLAAGAAIMAKQNYGGAVALALTVALVLLAWRGEGARDPARARFQGPFVFLLGGAVVVLPSLGYFAWHGALDEMLEQTVLFPFAMMGGLAFPRLPDLWPLLGQDPALRAEIGNYFPSILATLWWGDCPDCFAARLGQSGLYRETAFWDIFLKITFWLPIFVVVAALPLWGGAIAREALRSGIGEGSRSRLLVLALAVGFLLAFNLPRDWVHLMMIYPPALLVGTALAYQATEQVPRVVRRAMQGMLLGALGILFAISLALGIDMRRRIDYWLDSPRAQVYADRMNGPLIDEVLAWVEKEVPPGQPVPVYPMQPALGFLAGRETVAGYHVIWPMQAADRDQRILDLLEERGVQRVLFSISQWSHLGSFQQNAPRLFDALVDGWEIDTVFNREANGPILVALRRRSPPGPQIELQHLLADRGAELHWTRWPFVDVLAQPIGSLSAPRPLRIRFRVPAEHPFFATAIGMNPDRWLGPPTGPLTFRISREAFDGRAETLFERSIDPRSEVSERRWIPVSIDLSKDAGEPITLILSIQAREALEDVDLAGWAAPTLAAPSAARLTGHVGDTGSDLRFGPACCHAGPSAFSELGQSPWSILHDAAARGEGHAPDPCAAPYHRAGGREGSPAGDDHHDLCRNAGHCRWEADHRL